MFFVSKALTMAGASRRTSLKARLRPLAPVGGTVCPASPARTSRPQRMVSWTNERKISTVFSKIGPSLSWNPSAPCNRPCNSAQIRSSDQLSTFSVGSHWKYIRCTDGVRWLIRAKPRSEWL